MGGREQRRISPVSKALNDVTFGIDVFVAVVDVDDAIDENSLFDLQDSSVSAD
jgi:hypothetical protein